MSDMNMNRIGGYGTPEAPAKSQRGKPEKRFSSLLRETAGAQAAHYTAPLRSQDRRRQIADAAARLWQAGIRQWQAESAGMDLADGMIYCDEKAAQWVADLMENEPAMFREWLEQEKWHIEESGIDNAILPDGFTEEDMSRWLAKDVLEYLK